MQWLGKMVGTNINFYSGTYEFEKSTLGGMDISPNQDNYAFIIAKSGVASLFIYKMFVLNSINDTKSIDIILICVKIIVSMILLFILTQMPMRI